MFTSDATTHMPGEVVRFGKCWHGLVKTNAVKSPSTTQLVTTYNDVTFETRGGKVMPFPIPPHLSGATARNNLSTKFGPMCVYQHPLAQMDIEDDDGRDWSGYVIFDIRNNNFPTGLAGYRYGAAFAFTPDGNSQGLLVGPLTGLRSMSVWKPLKANKMYYGGGGGWHEYLPAGTSPNTIFYTKDGRTMYTGRFPRPSEIFDLMHNPNWSDDLAPKVDKIDLSGGIDEFGDLQLDASVNSVAVPSEATSDVQIEDQVYSGLSIRTPIYGLCTSPDFLKVDEETWSGTDIADAPPGMTVVASSVNWRHYTLRKSYIQAAVSDTGSVSYLSYKYEDEYLRTGGGSVTGSGSFTTGPEGECQNPEAKIVTSTYRTISSTTNLDHSTNTDFVLEGYGSSSTLNISNTSSESSTTIDTLINNSGSPVTTSSNSWTWALRLDGKTLLNGSGLAITNTLTMIGKPQRPDMNFIVPNSGFMSIRMTEDSTIQSGRRWAIIQAYLADYGSNDMRAIAVVVERGTINVIDDEPVCDPSTYTSKLYIGKTFARGIVDNYTHEQSFLDEVFLMRTYDPVDKKVSAIYPYPVAYQ